MNYSKTVNQKFSMKRIVLAVMGLVALSAGANAQENTEAKKDSVKVRYIYTMQTDGNCMPGIERNHVIFVNENVTTHVIMPENIKLVDMSTDKIVGNQCADNIVRIKPSARMRDHELVGTISVIGERHLAQYDVVYTAGPACANSIYRIQLDEMKRYKNPDVLMPESEMAAYAWAIYGSQPNYNNIHYTANGIRAVVNNIYTVNDYYFIDYSLYNRTKIKYDIDEVRIKLTDKKETKATNSQTIELTPTYSLNSAHSFKKAYRNVIVLPKLTFPDEKVLRIEIAERQISGRVIYIPIEYEDILNADGFDKGLLRRLPFNINR